MAQIDSAIMAHKAQCHHGSHQHIAIMAQIDSAIMAHKAQCHHGSQSTLPSWLKLTNHDSAIMAHKAQCHHGTCSSFAVIAAVMHCHHGRHAKLLSGQHCHHGTYSGFAVMAHLSSIAIMADMQSCSQGSTAIMAHVQALPSWRTSQALPSWQTCKAAFRAALPSWQTCKAAFRAALPSWHMFRLCRHGAPLKHCHHGRHAKLLSGQHSRTCSKA